MKIKKKCYPAMASHSSETNKEKQLCTQPLSGKYYNSITNINHGDITLKLSRNSFWL